MRSALEVLTELNETKQKMLSKDVHLYQFHQLLKKVDQLKEEYQSLPDKRIKCQHNYYFNKLIEHDNGFKELIIWKEEIYEDGTYYYGKSAVSKEFLVGVTLSKSLEQFKNEELIKTVDTLLEMRI